MLGTGPRLPLVGSYPFGTLRPDVAFDDQGRMLYVVNAAPPLSPV
jgi:hypothetical protein